MYEYMSIYTWCVLAEHLASFENVCAQMLEDVQERLVYRTHIYIRAEILGYKPAQGDLAYPEKLIMMEVSDTCTVHVHVPLRLQ